MKIKRVQPGSESFVPVTFQVTFETFDELLAMWHRLNVHTDNVYKNSKSDYPPGKDNSYPLFQWLNLELHNYDIPKI